MVPRWEDVREAARGQGSGLTLSDMERALITAARQHAVHFERPVLSEPRWRSADSPGRCRAGAAAE